MINEKVCEWLMEHGDICIKYRVAGELLGDEQLSAKLEKELFQNKQVNQWLSNLKPNDPPPYFCMEHGSLDIFIENALTKLVQLGLDGQMQPIRDGLRYYLEKMKVPEAYDSYFGVVEKSKILYRTGKKFPLIISANLMSHAGICDEAARSYMLGSLDEMYHFVSEKNYDFYLTDDEKKTLKRVPKVWKENPNYIRPELTKKYQFSYPLIYDLFGMYRLYDLGDPETNRKVDCVIDYISTDEFHQKIADGFGILVEENGTYHAMGWDPKYPGWFDLPDTDQVNCSKLLFFTLIISKYHGVTSSPWFLRLKECLDRFRTDEEGIFEFPASWLKETTGYAMLGQHMSFGENRRKKDWRKIESTFYMQLLSNSTSRSKLI